MCVHACLQGGQWIHHWPEGEMACVLPGRTISLESSLSCNGIVHDSILFGMKKKRETEREGEAWEVMVEKPRAGI